MHLAPRHVLSLLPFLALVGCSVDGPLDGSDLSTEADVPQFGTGDDAELALATELASPHLTALAAKHGIPTASDLLVTRVRVDELDTAHTRVQQTLRGVPVFGGEAIVHLDRFGFLTRVTDTLVDDVDVDTTPDLDADEATDLAVDANGGWDSTTDDPTTDLWILRHDDQDHLVWRVQLAARNARGEPAMPVVFIDAHTGEEVWHYNNLQTASGTSAFYGSVSFSTYSYGGSYYLEDTTRDIGTYTFNHTTSSLSYITDSDDSWSASSGVDGHYAASQAYDYYLNTFGRAGIDGANGPGYISSLTGSGTVLSMLVSYGNNYVNAYWDGTKIVAGDGDGTNSNALTTLDIIGHELTHGVTQYEANLTYANESGALNEAVSDMFGAMVERYARGESSNTWLIGEATWTPRTAGDALRYMNYPTADGSSKDHYSSRYTGSADSGGVHYNSGIANVQFYMLAAGGQHPRLGGVTVTGVGADAAAAIWYRALATYMTSSTNFSGARTATLAAAADLYGSTSAEYAAVQDSWYNVGVGDSSSGGGGGGGGGTATCGGTEYTGTLSRSGRSDYLPTSSGYSASSGTQDITLSGPSSADFDLYLYKKSGSRWSTVASSTGSTSEESISYAGSSGTYRVRVYSYSGSGDYTACIDIP